MGSILPFRPFLAAGKAAAHRFRDRVIFGPGLVSDLSQKRPADGDGLLLVVGNESADLDSMISSLVLSFLWSHQHHDHRRQAADVETGSKRLESDGRVKPVRALVPVPLLPIRRSEIRLRGDFIPALATISVHPDELVTLDDLGLVDQSPSKSVIDQIQDRVQQDGNVAVVLVDHNRLMPPLSPIFDSVVRGCLDHHIDEGWMPAMSLQDGPVMLTVLTRSKPDYNTTSASSRAVTVRSPRVIDPAGSCTSHVLRWGVDQNLWSTSSNVSIKTEMSGIAKLALASILTDTANLKARSKVTANDEWAVEFLTKIVVDADPTFDGTAWYDCVKTAKSDLDSFTPDEILRKDYKQWTSLDGSLVMGIPSCVRPVSYLISKARSDTPSTVPTSVTDLVPIIKPLSRDRNLGLFALLTSSSDKKGFGRELVMWSDSKDGIEAIGRFIEYQVHLSESVSDPTSHPEFLDMDHYENTRKKSKSKSKSETGRSGSTFSISTPVDSRSDEGWKMWAWRIRNKAASRKQVAPLIRRAVDQDMNDYGAEKSGGAVERRGVNDRSGI